MAERGDSKYKKPGMDIGGTHGNPPGSRHQAILTEYPNKSNPRNQGPSRSEGRAGMVGSADKSKRKTGKV